MSYFHFLNASNSFSLIVHFNGIPLFEAAILAHKQKVRSFESPPNQFLIYMIKAPFV